jgi:hypothetical protein
MNEAISESLAPAGVSRATRQGTTVVQTHPASSIANAEAHGRRSRTVQPLVGGSELKGEQ